METETITPVTTTRSSGYDQSRRKRKKKPTSPSPPPSSSSVQKWRSEKQQQIYSTNIIQSLRELRLSAAADPSAKLPPRGGGGRAVRDAAYRSLAVTARGRTLWSRAILSKAVRVKKLKFRKLNRSRNSNPTKMVSITGGNRVRKRGATVLRLKGKGLPAVQKKVKFLSRLIPGCREQPLPVVLEETTDYIVAMEMQIRALNAIISAVGSGSRSSPPTVETGHDGEETRMLG